MTLQVIGAGLGRTGTYSLKLALEQLGCGPCYHMEEVVKDAPTRVAQWNAALAGAPDWKAMFAGYGSAVDWPTASFYRELAEAYPQAKVVLTIRDSARWRDSVSETIFALMDKIDEAPAEMRPWFEMCIAVVERAGFSFEADAQGLIGAFEAHTAAVKSAIPPERLLVFEVKDGWAPLCAFLGKPAPSEPFPKTNNREEFWELASKAMG